MNAPPAATAPELALVAHAGGSGLANNATMFQQALQVLDVSHGCFDQHTGALLHRHSPAVALPLPGSVALFAVNADELPAARARFEARHPQARTTAPHARRIGFFLWETTRAPRLHQLVLPLLHEVWVPTEFVRRVYRELYDDAVPVHNVGKCLAVPPSPPAPPEVPSQAAPGHPSRPFTFLNISDFDSGIARKNPLSVVLAFRQAFRDDPDVRLVLKVRRIDLAHWSNAGHYWEQVTKAIAADPRISILGGNLPQADYWALLRRAGCYVTLHRAEGFCYGAAHAMLLDVPVIATDFSGTQDFCTADTAWLVAAEAVPVRPGEMRYHEPLGDWAEPDLDQAVAQMRAVRQGGSGVAARTAAARLLVSAQYGAAAFHARLRSRLAAA